MRISLFIFKIEKYVDDWDWIGNAPANDITASDQRKYIEELKCTAGNTGGISLMIMAVLTAISSVSYILCGKLFLGLIAASLVGYLWYRAKAYRWVYPIGCFICSAAAFVGWLSDIKPLAFLPGFAFEAITTLYTLSIPVNLIIGLVFLYSKKINAHIDLVEQLSK